MQSLIKKYKATGDPALKTKIVNEMLPLVKNIAGKITRPSTSLASHQDLISIGVEGLLEALESYDPTKGIQFNTFAYYRIRGSIIDYLRSIDELPRTKRSAYGKAQQTISRLQQLLGRMPLNQEVADEIGISLQEYEQLLCTVQQRAALSLEAGSEEENLAPVAYAIEDDTFGPTDAGLITRETSELLKSAIEALPKREQIILVLYYYEEYTLKEIAEVVHLSEARISQIIGKTLMKLRGCLAHSLAA